MNPGLSATQVPGVLSAPMTHFSCQLTSNQRAIVSHPCPQFTHTPGSTAPLLGQQNTSVEASAEVTPPLGQQNASVGEITPQVSQTLMGEDTPIVSTPSQQKANVRDTSL